MTPLVFKYYRKLYIFNYIFFYKKIKLNVLKISNGMTYSKRNKGNKRLQKIII